MKSVNLTITKLGIASCEKIFKPGIQIFETPEGEKLRIATILNHEDLSINLDELIEKLKPVKASRNKSRGFYMTSFLFK